MPIRLVNKPILLNARHAHKAGLIKYLKNGTADIKYRNITARVSKYSQYDLTQPTIFGLNERLTSNALSPLVDQRSGATLRDLFNKEWDHYQKSIDHSKSHGRGDYGVYAYYSNHKELVRFCPAYWHRVVSVASSSMLIADAKRRLSWCEIRKILAQTTVAVSGSSVGNSIFHAVIMDLRPDCIKIADKGLYKLENINRVRMGYRDIVGSVGASDDNSQTSLRNKAVVTAEQAYAMDPFINIHVYDEGVNSKNILQFLKGGVGEPKADIVVEETDDPRIKILIRQRARDLGIPVLMMTDLGSSVQMDISRYDLNSNLPLSIDVSDKELEMRANDACMNATDKRAFYKFVDSLVGTDYRTGEFLDIITERCEIPTSTIAPQLGSTATMAGAIAAETIARIRLGYVYPKRVFINKRSFDIKKYY